MAFNTVAILHPGEMGGAVGGALSENGYDVIVCLENRSKVTLERAQSNALKNVDKIDSAIAEADIVLCIMPPEFGLVTAQQVADAMRRTGCTPPYADCNAVAPDTARQMADVINAAGAKFIDGSIVGNPPGKGPKPTRFFVSGSDAKLMDEFDGVGISIKQCGPEVGRGAAVKMCYAGITKGTSALHAALLIAAEGLGVADELFEELTYSQEATLSRMERMTPALPAVSARYIGEMREIAKTLASIGLTGAFHNGAADLYQLMEKTPLADEIRETVDKDRTLRQTIEVCAEYLPTEKTTE